MQCPADPRTWTILMDGENYCPHCQAYHEKEEGRDRENLRERESSDR
jgi:uncharacterized Zn finger protein (UPF0148 family)